MLQGAPEFTPRQLLEAGRRSESESKPDFAVQFYLHIIENYGQTPEAAEARTALSRMAGAGPKPPEADADAQAAKPPELPQPAAPSQPQAQSLWQAGSVPRQDRYRSGRVIGAIFSGLGWVTINASLLLLGVYAGARIFQIAILQPFDLGNDLLVRLPAVTLMGAVLVVFGQIARALLDKANATRELLTIERVRSGLDQA